MDLFLQVLLVCHFYEFAKFNVKIKRQAILIRLKTKQPGSK